MGIYATLIAGAIQGGIALYSASQSPSYPSPPKLRGIDVPAVEAAALQRQSQGYQFADKRYAARYPLLARGRLREINRIVGEQQGPVSGMVSGTLKSTGLEGVPAGNEYQVSQQLGLPVLAKLQRDRQNLNRVIAENPQRVGPLSGTQVATLMANNYKNANAFNQQLLGIQMNNYAGATNQYTQNLAAVGPAIGGLANAGVQAYQNYTNPLSLGTYQAGQSYGYVPAYTDRYSSSSPDAGNPYYTGS